MARVAGAGRRGGVAGIREVAARCPPAQQHTAKHYASNCAQEGAAARSAGGAVSRRAEVKRRNRSRRDATATPRPATGAARSTSRTLRLLDAGRDSQLACIDAARADRETRRDRRLAGPLAPPARPRQRARIALTADGAATTRTIAVGTSDARPFAVRRSPSLATAAGQLAVVEAP